MHRLHYFILVFFFVPKIYCQYWFELGGSNSLDANFTIRVIRVDRSANLYAAGNFTNSLGNTYVAKWNGANWSELGGYNSLGVLCGGAVNSLLTLVTDSLNNVYVAGGIRNLSDNSFVAKWNGSHWSELGGLNSFPSNGMINSICSDAQGNIYAAGTFKNINGNQYVAKWDGTGWIEVGNYSFSNILSICVDHNANLYVVDDTHPVLKWNGFSWSELGQFVPTTGWNLTTLHNDISGNVYLAGNFVNASSKRYVAQWDGNNWVELGGSNSLSANGQILSLCSDKFGNIYAGGSFLNGPNMNNGNSYVAIWNGVSWSELGGINSLGANYPIWSICVDNENNLYAAGEFTNGAEFTMGSKYVTAYGITAKIEKKLILHKFNVYPNPTSGSFTIEADDQLAKEAYFLYDTHGRLINTGVLTGKEDLIQINGGSGFYFLKICDEVVKVQVVK